MITTLLLALGALAFVGFTYYRLIATTRLSPRQLWLLPLLAGFLAVTNVPADLFSNEQEVQATVLSVALGALGGILPALFIRVRRDADGQIWQEGSWLAAVLVVATIPLRFGLRFLLLGTPTALGGGPAGFSHELLFTYLAMFLALSVARNLTLLVRFPVIGDVLLSA